MHENGERSDNKEMWVDNKKTTLYVVRVGMCGKRREGEGFRSSRAISFCRALRVCGVLCVAGCLVYHDKKQATCIGEGGDR
jgi:hypothetical protein